jgi:hypothetical protein
MYIKYKGNNITLIIPKKVTWINVRVFINEIAPLDLTNFNHIVLDAREILWIEPLASLLLISFLEKRILTRPDLIDKLQYYTIKNFNSYAAYIGFYRALSISIGKELGEALGNSQYIPITKIEISQLKEEARHNHTTPTILLEQEAYRLGNILSSKVGQEESGNLIGYSIFEMLRNIIEHSESEYIWFCAQVWPRINDLEVAIVDTGIGIKASIESNKYYHQNLSNVEAIQFALEPGVSKSYKKRKRNNPFLDEDPYANSGFGLYVMHNLCRELGEFKIVSTGDSLTYRGATVKLKNCNFDGTAIGMRFRISDLNRIPGLRAEIIKTGEELTRSKDYVIKDASTASKANGPISKFFKN